MARAWNRRPSFRSVAGPPNRRARRTRRAPHRAPWDGSAGQRARHRESPAYVRPARAPRRARATDPERLGVLPVHRRHRTRDRAEHGGIVDGRPFVPSQLPKDVEQVRDVARRRLVRPSGAHVSSPSDSTAVPCGHAYDHGTPAGGVAPAEAPERRTRPAPRRPPRDASTAPRAPRRESPVSVPPARSRPRAARSPSGTVRCPSHASPARAPGSHPARTGRPESRPRARRTAGRTRPCGRRSARWPRRCRHPRTSRRPRR